jgi:hypothetical protein
MSTDDVEFARQFLSEVAAAARTGDFEASILFLRRTCTG